MKYYNFHTFRCTTTLSSNGEWYNKYSLHINYSACVELYDTGLKILGILLFRYTEEQWFSQVANIFNFTSHLAYIERF